MAFMIRFTKGAQGDLRSIHAYICKNDCPENADYVAREIVKATLTLRELPQRGAHPPELLLLGSRSYRQIFFKPYRILYKVRSNTVFVAVIADGRRDMGHLLARRLAKS